MSDLPTTVTTDTPKAAGPKGLHRPQPIVFFCPNGHRIVVDAAMAGKKGRCRECKEIVTVPQMANTESSPPTSPRPPASAPGVASESRAVHREPTDGPSLIINEPPPPGRPSRNTADKTVIGEPLIEGESALIGPSIDPAEVQIRFADETDAADDAEHAARIADEASFGDVDPVGSTVLVNPTARLMERLWYERRHGGVIEVHLAGAVSPILPSYVYPAWSDGSHGLFASLAADGTVTLTAVAWESVQKIVVRHVDSIPPDFLDIGLDE
jgi:hypothetical protein